MSWVEGLLEFLDNLSSDWNIFTFYAVNINLAFFQALERNDFPLPNKGLQLSAPLEHFVDYPYKGILKFDFHFSNNTFVLAVFTA
jgi:hypothetical protein